jgi:hypothetical protein
MSTEPNSFKTLFTPFGISNLAGAKGGFEAACREEWLFALTTEAADRANDRHEKQSSAWWAY